MFARVFRAKEALCINDTCVNEDQLKSLLLKQSAKDSEMASHSRQQERLDHELEERPFLADIRSQEAARQEGLSVRLARRRR
jgi:hypothetical protein